MARLPKLRDDLTLSDQSTPEGRVVIAKDPRTGRFFRMREVEAFIAMRLDGVRDPATLRAEAEEHFGGMLPEEILRAFLATLDREGLLERTSSGIDNRPRRKRGFRGSLFYLRYPLFDPDRLLTRLRPWTGWMFTRAFAVCAALLAGIAILLVGANWNELLRELAGLYKLQMLPVVVLTAFSVITAHELAHGMTCKRFGGEVREIGFILIYFQPAMYCNVSDSWLFPERSKRLLVGLAGPGFELFLWSIATLLWRFSEVDTWIHSLSLIVLAISGLKTLINFNPFIKLDGYYLLSDFLEIPNLRRRSFRYIGDGMRRFFLGVPRPEPLPSRRERRIFGIYGAIASFTSFAIAGYALVVSGTYFLESHQPVALFLATGLLGLVSQRRVRSLFGANGGDSADAAPQGEASSARSGLRGPATPGRRRWAWGILGLAALGLSFVVQLELRIGGQFDVIPVGVTEVRATVEGVVDSVLVSEGGAVAAGQAVVRLAGREIDAKAEGLDAQIRETRAELGLLEAGPRREEIEVARLASASARDRLTYARRRHAMDVQLLDNGLVSRKAFDETEAAVAQSENEVAAAEARWNQLVRGSRPEELDAMRARLERLQTEFQFVVSERQRLSIVSPVAGLVATPNLLLQALPGRLVSKGGLVAEVYDPERLVAAITVPEKEIADVVVGQRVVLRARAFPGEAFDGVVRSIAIVASEGRPAASGTAAGSSNADPSGSRKFLVTASLDNRSRRLQPEMSGQAKILCGPRSVAALVTRRLVRTFKIEVWSWW